MVQYTRLVMKFGGTSVADISRIKNVATHVAREVAAGKQVAVVVSAMAGVTDRLVKWCQEAAFSYDFREYDAIVATGEQVTAGLLAIVLQSMGLRARSWQGWQVPIQTDAAHGAARILGVNATLLSEQMEKGIVAVITGFQGVSEERRVSTLGRGGSDTSAVALAAALGARCDIYTDVDGIYTADPRVAQKARKVVRISYEEMLEMASLGSKVLHPRSVELAMVYRVPLQVRSSFDPPDQIPQGEDFGPGTLVCDESNIMEQQVVTGIACSRNESKIIVHQLPDVPSAPASVFEILAQANILVDMIVQNSLENQGVSITFTLNRFDLDRALESLNKAQAQLGFQRLEWQEDVAKVSVVGVGMRSHAGVAARMFSALAEKGIAILAISTSEIKVSVLIDPAYAELAVRTLHTSYGLDEKPNF